MLSAEALLGRELLAQHLELGNELRVVAERELRLDPHLDRAQAQLFQASRLELEPKRPSRPHRGGRARARGRHGAVATPRPDGLHELGRV